MSNAPWSDYVTSNTAQLSSNGSSVFGRYAEIEFFLSLISGQTTPSLTSLSVTYNDYLSGIVYADSNIPVPANIKVIMQVNGTIKGSTTTDRDGRYHFGNLGVKNGDNIKLYLESDDYAGAISASATNRENLNLNMYGRKIVKPVDPINPTTSPGITPSSPTPPSVSPVVNKPITEVNVYRLRNKKSLRYFYTSFDSEKNQAVASGQWKLEGTLGKAYTGQAVGTIPIFRLYNTGNKVYLLTGSEFEKNQALAKNKNFKFEGVSFYAYPDTAGGNKPMYRFCYRYLGGVYYYTISSSEAKSLKKKFWLWRYEGIGFKLK